MRPLPALPMGTYNQGFRNSRGRASQRRHGLAEHRKLILQHLEEHVTWHPADILFTSESVSMGHPDKLADQISDGVLDALLAQDPMSRVACETMVTTGLCRHRRRDHDQGQRRLCRRSSAK